MRIKLDLDSETTERLIQAAISENRPVGMHAEVVIRRALGLPFPWPQAGAAPTNAEQEKASAPGALGGAAS